MTVTLKTTKIVWGKAASRCCICRNELVIDESEADDPSLIGDICHIVAESPQGPRGDSLLTEEQRNLSTNLLLLCKNHHKEIDDQPRKYTVEELHRIKQEHDSWIKGHLSIDLEAQHLIQTLASYIDTWGNLSHIDEWDDISYRLFHAALYSVRRDIYDDFVKLNKWLLTRVWLNNEHPIPLALINFRRILNDFLTVFSKRMKDFGEDAYIFDKFYKVSPYDDTLYKKLADQYDFETGLLLDLFCELTRAGNLICDYTRSTLHRTYRIDTGVLTIMSGDIMGTSRTRLEYTGPERASNPQYPGLQQFYKDRTKRSLHHCTDKIGKEKSAE